MLWFKSRYVRLLEEERSRLLEENKALKATNDLLTQRLSTIEHAVVPLKVPPTLQGIEKMLQETDLFEDIETVSDGEVTDNRKGEYDAY